MLIIVSPNTNYYDVGDCADMNLVASLLADRYDQ